MPEETTDEIQLLQDAKDKAYREWIKLEEPANKAHKKYQEASAKLRYAEMYQKAKRQVLRDLIRASGNQS